MRYDERVNTQKQHVRWIMRCMFSWVMAGMLALTGSAAFAQETETMPETMPEVPAMEEEETMVEPETDRFADWDADGDGILDESEFADSGFYDRWDADGIEGLTRSEFGDRYGELGFFDAWADDGAVVRDRFGFANDAWFTQWDSDASEDLSRLEFTHGAFETWDVNDDGLIDSDELNSGVLSAWDRDASGDWSSDEFSDASPFLDDVEP